MEKIKIDLSDVVREVKRLGVEYPEFVYKSVGYYSYITKGECPPCVVGLALQNLGVPESVLESAEAELEDSSVGEFLDPYREGSPFEVTYAYGDLSYLAAVQSRQDRQIPWGQAVAA